MKTAFRKIKRRIPRQNKEYHLFNLLIVLLVGLLFLYAWSDTRLLQCPYARAGLRCETCGLTTSFQSLLRGNREHIIPGHLLFFLFFASQLLLRPLISYLLMVSTHSKQIRTADLVISLLLFGLSLGKLSGFF